MSFSQDLVIIAKIGAPHGVRGDLVLHVFMEDPETVLEFQENKTPLMIEGRSSSFCDYLILEKYKIIDKGGKFYINFENYLDRDLARRFVNKTIAVSKKLLPALEQDEVYWADLIGLEVFNQDNKSLGLVDHVFDTGANDVLVIKKPEIKNIEIIEIQEPEIKNLENKNLENKKLGLKKSKKIKAEDLEILIPYVGQHVISVDLDNKKIRVNWDENF